MRNINSIRRICVLSIAVLAGACGSKYEIINNGDYFEIHNRGGKTLGVKDTSAIQILTLDRYAFKDLNHNGIVDPYEDWRLTSDVRAKDLAGRLSIEEIAGLMVYSKHQKILTPDLTQDQVKLIVDNAVRHILITNVENPVVAAEWNNAIQSICESTGYGIPSNNSSDPRHGTISDDEFNLGAGGKISIWPGLLGMACSFDPGMILRFGEVASIEYRALGMATALSPQIDLATDPRWRRCFATFGEGSKLSIDYARAYSDGFQTSKGSDALEGAWGFGSVNAMVKHWPGGGTGEAGRDAHFAFGKYAVYPGSNFEEHLLPFTEGAFKLKDGTLMASAVMPYYTISYGVDPSGKNVANAYSEYLIKDLLRGKYNYDGVICTDWNVVNEYNDYLTNNGKPWGVESMSEVERYYTVILNGIDQFGGVSGSGKIVEAYNLMVERLGETEARDRIEESAVRLLKNIFRPGLFENPYLCPAESGKIVGCPEFMAEGFEAQKRTVVMLKNHNSSLPIKERLKVYVPMRRLGNTVKYWTGEILQDAHEEYGASPNMISQYYDVVANPEEADFAIAFIKAPEMSRGYDTALEHPGERDGYVPISLQYAPYTAVDAREYSIAGGDPLEKGNNRSYRDRTSTVSNFQDADIVKETRQAMGNKPVIVVVQAQRPMVFAEIEPFADAILIGFEIQNQAFMEIISGNTEPSALLPMQMPRDMRTVELQCEDLPFDMECYVDADGNAYDYAYGLNWSGIINDSRTAKYSPAAKK